MEAAADLLAAVVRALGESDQARALLQPGTPVARQRALVEALAPALSPLLANFLRLLVERSRFEGLAVIALSFADLVDAHLGRVRVKLLAPKPLPEPELLRVREALEAATRKRILLEAAVDESLIGGLTADVGGTLYDGSIRTQLARLRDELEAG